MTSYKLKAGTYIMGDPALIFKKVEGIKLSEALWKAFYIEPQKFQKLTLDDITFYITKTKEGDGYFDGVGTDSGTIMIIDATLYVHDHRLNLKQNRLGMLTLNFTDDVIVSVCDFVISFEVNQTLLHRIKMFD